MKIALAAGAALGVVYTLSPLTVLFLACIAPYWTRVSRSVAAQERDWLAALLVTALALRLAAVAILFLTADSTHPFNSFFGDEELFKSRTVWLRNVGLGIPISKADYIYTFDDVGRTSYQPLLAYLQALFGEAPYGIHVFNVGLYFLAAGIGYRVVRAALGGLVAIGALAGWLFMPSLFMWSVSALREPAHLALAMSGVACTVAVVRAPTLLQRGAAIAAVVAIAFVLESLRTGGAIMTAIGTAGGLLLAAAVRRPAIAAAFAAALLIVVAVPQLRERAHQNATAALRYGAFQHAGHLATAGYTYPLISGRYYPGRIRVWEMPAQEAYAFGLKAMIAYFTEPVPWRIESRRMLLYLPEHLLWYVLLALTPWGIAAAMRRDVVVSCILLAHAAGAILAVALTGGNIGTLIRHRGLALPYIFCFGVAGAIALLRTALPAEERHGAGR